MEDKYYHLSSKESGVVFIKAMGITVVIMLLFYRSAIAGISFPIIYYFVWCQAKKEGLEKSKMQLQGEFLHGISVLNSSLQAGFSMENAWKEVERETRVMYGEASQFYLGIKEVNQKVAHNAPLEKLFLEFAYQNKIEDMIQFAELLEFGKRNGSNWKQIIDVTVCQMTERQEARQQIEVMVAEKKMEQKVMTIVPLGLLAFLQFSAWDYMSVMYHNWLGVIAMTVFLLIYAGAIRLSQKILKVQI